MLTASASRLGGGVATAVEAQSRMIRDAGGRVTVIALADRFSEVDRANYGDTPLRTAAVTGPGAIGYAPHLAALLGEVAPDILHLHGIWMYPSRAGAQWARRTGRPYMISPHGMLDPWITARGRWKKALARTGYERASWRRATLFHALTPDEGSDIRREAGPVVVQVIPNAGPPPFDQAPSDRPPILLYLGRIHPKKNLDGLIAAWRGAARPMGAELQIAGWGDPADVAALETLIAQAADPTIRFLGPVHGEAKQRLLASARFIVLPSFSEGLPMVVLEAWAAGTPTLMTQACHLPVGFAAGAALDCGTNPQAIRSALERGLALPHSDWAVMANAALELARGPFSADAISQRWIECYCSLVGGSAG